MKIVGNNSVFQLLSTLLGDSDTEHNFENIRIIETVLFHLLPYIYPIYDFYRFRDI